MGLRLIVAITSKVWAVFGFLFRRGKLGRHRQEILAMGFVPVGFRAEKTGCWEVLTSHSPESFLAFQGEAAEAIFAELKDFYPFGVGDWPKITEAYRKDEEEFRIYLFSYQYTTGDLESGTVHYFHCALFQSRYFLPSISWRPETTRDRLSGAIGLSDIQFESHEFNQRFFVESDDPKFAFAAIHPNLMEEMLRSFSHSWQVKGRNALCVTSKWGGPGTYTRIRHEIAMVHAHLPPYLREQYGGMPISQQPDFGEKTFLQVKS